MDGWPTLPPSKEQVQFRLEGPGQWPLTRSRAGLCLWFRTEVCVRVAATSEDY